jgi:hypothetical protein
MEIKVQLVGQGHAEWFTFTSQVKALTFCKVAVLAEDVKYAVCYVNGQRAFGYGKDEEGQPESLIF